MDNAEKLLELAAQRLGTLTKAEQKLFRAVAGGELADFSAESDEANDPAGAERWGPERVVEAGRIVWLCTDPQASALVAHRGVRVKGARIDGELDLKLACIPFPLCFENSAIRGAVNLHRAEIRELCLSGSHTGPIIADGLQVRGDVFLCDGFAPTGKVDLAGATIGGCFGWTSVSLSAEVTLDLRSAKVGTLRDDAQSWPSEGKLHLHGLVYDGVHEGAPTDAARRIEWLHRQPSDAFHPQPYAQLASVLRMAGRGDDATRILIQKEKDRSRLADVPSHRKLWHWLLGVTIVYGYRPWRAFWIGLAVIAMGTVLFGIGSLGELLVPTKQSAYVRNTAGPNGRLPENYPNFHPFVYSLDMFVPLVDLHQASYWLPNANRGHQLFTVWRLEMRTGRLLRAYLWIHIAAGWVLTTLLVVGLTGLVRR